jgi:hypothetical protein
MPSAMQDWNTEQQRNSDASNKMFLRIKVAGTKEEARGVVEEMARQWYAARPQVPIEEWREAALDHIGWLSGLMEIEDADRVLDLFETVHPWRDRQGNRLPFERKRGQSRRARAWAVLLPLVYACTTKEQARLLVEEEAINRAADKPNLNKTEWRQIMLESIWFELKSTMDPVERGRLSELFDM